MEEPGAVGALPRPLGGRRIVRRVHVACSSIPALEERLAALAARGLHVDAAQPGWPARVRPGDVVVADYFADTDELAAAARHGASWLHVLSTGLDAFPLDDLPYPTITCSRGISGGPIAEYVLAMLLARAKRLDDLLRAGDTVGPLDELAGTQLAIYGYGAIGRETARRATAFAMRVRVLWAHPERCTEPGIEVVHQLGDLAQGANHLVIAAPLTAATRHVIGAAVFDALAPGAHVVNVARGPIIDHEALLRALDRGQVGFATLDVTEPEPLPAGHALAQHPRVVVTRHLAGRVAAAADRNWAVFADNVDRWLSGRPFLEVVDRTLGY